MSRKTWSFPKPNLKWSVMTALGTVFLTGCIWLLAATFGLSVLRRSVAMSLPHAVALYGLASFSFAPFLKFIISLWYYSSPLSIFERLYESKFYRSHYLMQFWASFFDGFVYQFHTRTIKPGSWRRLAPFRGHDAGKLDTSEIQSLVPVGVDFLKCSTEIADVKWTFCKMEAILNRCQVEPGLTSELQWLSCWLQ